jgi:hypothetical protein
MTLGRGAILRISRDIEEHHTYFLVHYCAGGIYHSCCIDIKSIMLLP